jgi:hypothetical protein
MLSGMAHRSRIRLSLKLGFRLKDLERGVPHICWSIMVSSGRYGSLTLNGQRDKVTRVLDLQVSLHSAIIVCGTLFFTCESVRGLGQFICTSLRQLTYFQALLGPYYSSVTYPDCWRCPDAISTFAHVLLGYDALSGSTPLSRMVE